MKYIICIASFLMSFSTQASSLIDDFVQASCSGNKAALEAYLNYVPMIDINTKDSKGRLAINCAIQYRISEIWQRLLQDSRLDVDMKDSVGGYPLKLAITNSDDEVLGALLTRFPKLNFADYASSPNELLLYFGNKGFCRSMAAWLNQSSVDINYADNKGYTALMRLVEQGIYSRQPEYKCLSEIFAHKSIDLDQKNKLGENLQDVTAKAYPGRAAFTYDIYRFVGDLYRSRAFDTVRLGGLHNYYLRLNQDLSQVLAFSGSEIDSVMVYRDYKWNSPLTINLGSWARGCGYMGCTDGSISDSYFPLFQSSELLVKNYNHPGECLDVNLVNGSSSVISSADCEKKLENYKYESPALKRGPYIHVSCESGFGCDLINAQIPNNPNLSVSQYDYDGHFPSTLEITNPTAKKSFYYQVYGLNFVNVFGYGNSIIVEAAGGIYAFQIL